MVLASLPAAGEDDYVRDRSLGWIATAQARAGFADDALKTAGLIGNPLTRADALAQVTGVLARTGQGSRAKEPAAAVEACVRQADADERRIYAVANQGLAQALAGDRENAAKTFAAAEDAAGRQGDRMSRITMLSEVARREARAGLSGEALALLAKQPASDWRFSATTDVARLLWASGHRDGARMAAREVLLAVRAARKSRDKPSQPAESRFLRETAGIQADLGDYGAALETALAIANSQGEERMAALMAVGEAQARAGDAEAVMKWAEALRDPYERARVMARLPACLCSSYRDPWTRSPGGRHQYARVPPAVLPEQGI